MTSAEYRALNQKQPATPSKPAGKGKTNDDPNEGHSAKEMARIQAARSQAVGYGRRADTNTTFGVPIWVRRYHVLSAAEAEQLDAAFEAIVNHANL